MEQRPLGKLISSSTFSRNECLVKEEASGYVPVLGNAAIEGTSRAILPERELVQCYMQAASLPLPIKIHRAACTMRLHDTHILRAYSHFHSVYIMPSAFPQASHP